MRQVGCRRHIRAKSNLRKADSPGQGIHRIALHSDIETIEFERTGPDTMILRSTNGRQREYLYSEPSLTALMTEELSVIGPDPAFNTAFARAQELA